MLNTQASSAKKLTKDQLIVRINGTLPDISTLNCRKVRKSSRSKTTKYKDKHFLLSVCSSIRL